MSTPPSSGNAGLRRLASYAMLIGYLDLLITENLVYTTEENEKTCANGRRAVGKCRKGGPDCK